jgi:hypothetical protein
MITPEPRDDGSKQRRVAILATSGVVTLLGLLVAVVSVPDFTSPQEQFRKLDPQRFADFRVEPEPQPQEEDAEDESDSSEEENPKEAQENAEPQRTPERIEAPELSTDGAETSSVLNQTPQQSQDQGPSSAESSGGNSSIEVERENVGEVGGAETFDGPTETALPSGDNNQATSGADETGIAIAEGDGAGQGSSTGDDLGGQGAEVAAGGGTAGGEGGASVEVSLKDVDAEDYGNLEVNKLIKWMRQNPASLPTGIRQLVDYEENHLSSKLRPIEVEGQTYELYLMCKESLKEVHIVLVQDQRAQYLVDRAFQKQSRKFRAGPVRRSSGEIVGVETRGKPRGKEAENFYSIFLSWWKEAKKNVN